MARILVTSALPYINGITHLGNLIGSQLPADAYARVMRQRGHEVLLICATDEHGTPTELAAAKAGKSPAEFCDEMHEVQAGIAEGIRLSFDQIGNFLHDNDAGNIKKSLANCAIALAARDTTIGLTGGFGLTEHIVSDRLKPFFIDEGGQRDHANRLPVGQIIEIGDDIAIATD